MISPPMEWCLNGSCLFRRCSNNGTKNARVFPEPVQAFSNDLIEEEKEEKEKEEKEKEDNVLDHKKQRILNSLD